jgi:hypothetical protein
MNYQNIGSNDMSTIQLVPEMEFVCINTNNYEFEPDIEFEIESVGECRAYTIDEFETLISLCKRVGVPCTNLTDYLEEFQAEIAIFHSILPPEPIAAAM